MLSAVISQELDEFASKLIQLQQKIAEVRADLEIEIKNADDAHTRPSPTFELSETRIGFGKMVPEETLSLIEKRLWLSKTALLLVRTENALHALSSEPDKIRRRKGSR